MSNKNSAKLTFCLTPFTRMRTLIRIYKNIQILIFCQYGQDNIVVIIIVAVH